MLQKAKFLEIMSDDVKYTVICYMLGALIIAGIIVALIMFGWSTALRRRNRQAAYMIAEVKNAKEAIEKIDRVKTNFINSITHEIRTPLNAINGYIGLLASGGDDISSDEKREFMGIINENTDKLSVLFDNLLDLSSIGNEDYDIKLSTFPVSSIMEQAYHSAKPKEGVDLSMKYEISLDTLIESDRSMLTKILEALIDNACKFTTYGSIEIGCSKSTTPEKILFTVTDTGVGIPENKNEEIFKKFSKLNKWNEGVGLGLYLAKRMSLIINGSLTLDSRYTDGARFVLEVPLAFLQKL